MGEELIDDLDRFSSNQPDKTGGTMEAIINALNLILSNSQLDQKTELTRNNIIGMVRSLTFSNELYTLYGVDIRKTVLFAINEKLVKTISLDRQGRNEIIELVRAIRAELQATPLEDLSQKIVYGKR